MTEQVKEWIEEGKAEIQESGCIFWMKGKNRWGYGYLWRNGKTIRTHRFILELKLGRPIKKGMLACHTCHNRLCINEEHLYEGTPLSNMQDMKNAGRAIYAKGSNNGGAKLNEQQVLEIREKLAQGKTGISLAAEYNVCKANISFIKNNKRWQHIQQQ